MRLPFRGPPPQEYACARVLGFPYPCDHPVRCFRVYEGADNGVLACRVAGLEFAGLFNQQAFEFGVNGLMDKNPLDRNTGLPRIGKAPECAALSRTPEISI